MTDPTKTLDYFMKQIKMADELNRQVDEALFQKDWETCKNLVSVAIENKLDGIYHDLFVKFSAADRVDLLSLLLPVVDPAKQNSKALRSAAYSGALLAVKFLCPLSNPKANRSEALCWAAENKHLAVVKFLAPLSDPLARESMALQHVSSNRNFEMFHFLYPLSDPKAALDDMARRFRNMDDYLDITRLLSERLAVDDEKKLLQNKLIDVARAKGSSNKGKM